ncbi:hypothetical protein GGI09_005716 [Coemansia sp. S100]|nr:hypothetical protein GGI09_005716 [Coemansia sp. S100]
MPTLSSLQILPAHVVCLIVNHVAGSSRMAFAGVSKGSDEYLSLQMPLMWVCRNFHAIVSLNMYSTHEIILGGSQHDTLSHSNNRSQACGKSGSSHFYHLVKELSIKIDMVDVLSGHALELLSSKPYKDCVFPRARKIDFYFSAAQSKLASLARLPDHAAPNTSAFVQRIQQMAPAFYDISIVAPTVHQELLSLATRRLFTDLLAQLYQTTTRINHIYFGELVFGRSRLDAVRNLVYLSYGIMYNAMDFAQLARQNASTLQYLGVNGMYDFDVSALIRDGNRDYIEYLRLFHLDLMVWGYEFELRLQAFKGAILFPSLRCLKLNEGYPFCDNTPFRGNAATLKCLEISLDRTAVSVIPSHKVFTHSSHPRLQYGNTIHERDLVPNEFATFSDYIQFALDIAPSAPVWLIKGQYYNDLGYETSICQRSLPLFDDHASIQILSLPTTHLGLWKVVSLISSLPLLTDLCTLYPKLGPIPGGITLAKLPAYAISKYAPIGKRFWCWKFEEGRNRLSFQVVHCVLLLALMCPNFDCVANLSDEREDFMRMLKRTIGTKEYQQHASSLKRLLFD